jgi:uncharacterized protein (TIGR00251 family)
MIYHLLVKPNSRRAPLVKQTSDGLAVYVRAKAVDGAANRELVVSLAEHFGVPKTRVIIRHGSNSRHKTVEVV